MISSPIWFFWSSSNDKLQSHTTKSMACNPLQNDEREFDLHVTTWNVYRVSIASVGLWLNETVVIGQAASYYPNHSWLVKCAKLSCTFEVFMSQFGEPPKPITIYSRKFPGAY